MTTGSRVYEELPSSLWPFFMKAIHYYLLSKYPKNKSTIELQPWTLIPNDSRQWINLERLQKSIFSKKKNIVILDFDENSPALTTGEFCLDKLFDLQKSNNLRNIYMLDSSMKFFLLYIEDGGLLVEGDSDLVSKIFEKQKQIRGHNT